MVGTSSVTGTYTLRTVNGSSLPYTLPGGGTTKTEILDDVLNLYQGNTYSESGHMRVTVNGQVTTQIISEPGSYSLFGTSITFTSGDGKHIRLSNADSESIIFVEAGITQVFKK
ncbi:MAG TPA: hypothetical protein VKO87_02440 [Gemmatimonadaceae bacterium]|nr:hypothetical protein [Gemmatimonadaceae bacterium]